MKKYKLYQYLLFVLMALQSADACAQTKALVIGEIMPQIKFSRVFNYKTKQVVDLRMSDLKGKLVILDFWGTFCIPCIEEFPKLDSLQKMFDGKIQIIPVNPQRRDSIARFFKAHNQVFKPSLPFITGDTILGKLFPHTGVPFQVWISKSGKVLNLADSYNLTPKNIQAVLDDEVVSIRKAPKNVYPETLFDENWKDLIVFSSYIARDGYDKGLHLISPANQSGYTDGGTILYLYQRAYEELTNHRYEFFRVGRTMLDVKDSSKYIQTKFGEEGVDWVEKNCYHYQLTLPENYKGNKFELMKQDMDRYFQIEASIEPRKVKSLVLVRTSPRDKLKTEGGIEQNDFHRVDARSPQTGKIRHLTNQDFSVFINQLQHLVENGLHVPFQDSTAYTGKIDLEVKGEVLDHLNLAGLKQALGKYDMDLVEQDVLIHTLVLKEAITPD